MKAKPEILSAEYIRIRKNLLILNLWFSGFCGLFLILIAVGLVVIAKSLPIGHGLYLGALLTGCLAMIILVTGIMCRFRLDTLQEHEKMHALLTEAKSQNNGTQPTTAATASRGL